MQRNIILATATASALLVGAQLSSANAAGDIRSGVADRVGGAARGIGASTPALATPASVRRYKVEAVSFKAIDESGADWAGSDEVFGFFEVSGSRGENRELATRVYGDVDTGETKTLGVLDSCVWPKRVISETGDTGGALDAPADKWTCRSAGAAAPVTVGTALWEDDDTGFPTEFDTTGPGKPDVYDDFIGDEELTLTVSALTTKLPTVGATWTTTRHLGGPCGPFEGVCGTGPFTPTGPEYEVRLRVTRTADAKLQRAPIAQ